MKSFNLKNFMKKTAIFFAIMGPGLITANVDNDANGIATYSVAGANFGYSILWVLILVFVGVTIVQEMCARMGCVTQKGLADLIRENFGIKFTFFIMAILFIANLANTIGNFAGLALAGELFNIPKYISVIGGGIAIWFLIIKGSYKKIEKVFIIACLIYVTYIISGFMANPPWKEVIRQTFTPSFQFKNDYIYTFIALFGTSIAPWMQFYHQSAIRDKAIHIKHYIYARYDTILGSFMMNFVAFFIIVACAATLFIKGIKINSAYETALALEPLAGRYCKILFGIGLLNAALFSVSIIPLSTSYAIAEAFGWESGMGKSYSEAKAFYVIYTLLIVLSALFILLPNFPLLLIMVASQALNGILLPFILITMLILVNNKKIMGKWTNSWKSNLIAGFITALLIFMAGCLLFLQFAPK